LREAGVKNTVTIVTVKEKSAYLCGLCGDDGSDHHRHRRDWLTYADFGPTVTMVTVVTMIYAFTTRKNVHDWPTRSV
jgi:hypothetical protein